MELTMFDEFTISADVLGSCWDSLANLREHAWLIHVIPGVVNLC